MKCSKPHTRHKQPLASSDEEPWPQAAPLEDNKKPASTQCLKAPPQPEAPCVSCCQPQTPSAQPVIPRTLTCSRATVSDMKTSQLSTFQTKWTLPCWCNHWQAQLRLLWTEKNHLHSQTEAKSNFDNISRKGIVLCLPDISRWYYGGVGSLLMCDNSIKIYHNDKYIYIYIFSIVHFWKEASWHTNKWCIEQVTNKYMF